MASARERIEQDVKANNIIMYVKGNKMFPQCGFSKAVMDVFTQLNVPFETRDVLEDPEVRDEIKAFTNWPTIPQVFVKGKFIGGCDIVMELFQNGELQNIVKDATAE